MIIIKTVFVHGAEKIKIDEDNNYYTDGSYSEKIWNRYEKNFGNITAIMSKDLSLKSKKECEKNYNIINNSIKVELLETPKGIIDRLLFFNKARNNCKLVDRIIKENDFLIARIPSNISYKAIKYAKKNNIPCLAEVVGCPYDTLWNFGVYGKVLAIKNYFQMKHIVKKADYVIYVSNKFLQDRYPTNSISIGCSDVDIDVSDKTILQKRINKIDVNKNEYIIGTIGNVDVKYKGHKYVLKAIKNIKKTYKKINIKYYLIGGGNPTYLRKIIEKYDLTDNVIFLGSVNHDRISELLDKIDIYIHPSTTEGMCRSIIEAMSRACPCVVSNAGGNPELIDDRFVFKKKNVKDLVNKLMLLLQFEMKDQAIRNFNESKKYTKKELDNKRNKFYNKIINNINN